MQYITPHRTDYWNSQHRLRSQLFFNLLSQKFVSC